MQPWAQALALTFLKTAESAPMGAKIELRAVFFPAEGYNSTPAILVSLTRVRSI